MEIKTYSLERPTDIGKSPRIDYFMYVPGRAVFHIHPTLCSISYVPMPKDDLAELQTILEKGLEKKGTGVYGQSRICDIRGTEIPDELFESLMEIKDHYEKKRLHAKEAEKMIKEQTDLFDLVN